MKPSFPSDLEDFAAILRQNKKLRQSVMLWQDIAIALFVALALVLAFVIRR